MYVYVCAYIYLANRSIYMCINICMCVLLYIHICVYICMLLLTKLQLSREDTELQSVDISIISLPC